MDSHLRGNDGSKRQRSIQTAKNKADYRIVPTFAKPCHPATVRTPRPPENPPRIFRRPVLHT
ncbi:hypothetical protein [Neisseria sp.]|uniref:hypothetical protein n=1 Tax=Neisseria sp. TaxID=192066 RepID=UPI0035A11319